MATYNTVIKKRNANNDGWDSVLPITTAENVLTDDQGGTVATHLAETTQAHGGIVPPSRTVNGKALSANISLTAADVGAAATTHNHSAGNINSGTLAVARIPTGTSSSTVCIGNDSRLSNSRQCNNNFDNVATARTNLGLTGNSNTTHYHDGRYVQTRIYNGVLQYYDGEWKDVAASPIKSIQRGIEISDKTVDDITISFSSINPSKCMVLFDGKNGRYSSSGTSYTNYPHIISITSTSMTISTPGSTNSSYFSSSFGWQLIEFN